MTTKHPLSTSSVYLRELADFSIEAWTGNDLESTMRLRALGEISKATATEDLLRMAWSVSSPQPPEPIQRREEARTFKAPNGHASIR